MDSELTRKLEEAGVDLGAMAVQWGTRPDEPPACSVTDRDLRLLRFLHDFGYATTSTLAALFWGKYGSAARERLKLLHDAGFLDKLRPRVGRTRAAPEWIYRLTERGWQTLRNSGEPADHEPFRPAKLTSISYVEHDVQVAALVASIAARAAAFRRRTGPLIDAAPFLVLGPRAGTVDPRLERRATNASAAADLGARQVDLGASYPGVLKPDATLVGVDSDGRRTAVMLEFDRTRRPWKLSDRLRRYDWFLTAGWRESRYASLDIEPAVLIVADHERLLRSFARSADAHLTAALSEPRDTPNQRDFPGREQVGFTSRDRLVAGDERILQLPSPRRREHTGSSAHVRIERFPVNRLFAGN